MVLTAMVTPLFNVSAIEWPAPPSGETPGGKVGNVLHPDSDNERIGVGTQSPDAVLTVQGTFPLSTAGTLTVTNGSVSVTTTNDLTSYFAVGDEIEIRNSDPEESSVYTVGAIDGTTITLGAAYTGTSDSDGSAVARAQSDLVDVSDGQGNSKLNIDKDGNTRINAELFVEERVQTDSIFTTALGNFFSIFTDNLERLTVSDDGKLGIGTNSPAYQLDVSGDAHITGDTFLSSTTGSTGKDSGALVVDGGTGVEENLHVGGVAVINGTEISSDAMTTPVDGALNLETWTTGDGTPQARATITASGNMGIGDTTPGAHLVVGDDTNRGTADGAGDVYIQNDLEVDGTIYGDLSGDMATNVINMTGATGVNEIQITDNVADGLSLTEGTNDILTVTTTDGSESVDIVPEVTISGNLGVGTTDPKTSLQIDGSDALRVPVGTSAQRPAGASELQGQVRYNTDLSQFEGFDGSAWGSLGGAIDIDQDTQIHVEKNADEDMIRFDTAGTERMIIDESGNLGVGTSTPGETVDIVGTMQVSGNSKLTSTTTSTDKDTGALVIEGGLGLEENLNLGGNIDFTAGNHSIATSIGASDFTIGGSTSNVVIPGDLQVQGSATAVNTQNLDVTDQKLRVNVGGTTSTTIGAGLEIEGDAGATVGFVRVNSADNSLVEVKAPTGNTLTVDTDADSTITVNGSATLDQDVDTTSAPSFDAGLTVDTTTLKVDATNNRVGVGTATPAKTLDVDGTAQVSGDVLISATTTSTSKDAGALIVEGGVGIEENVNIGGTLDADGAATLGSTLGVTGVTTLSATTTSTSKDTGALVVEGGVGVEENVNVGGTLGVTGNTTLSATTTSTTKDTGALVVEGGVGVEENVNIGGTLDAVGAATLGSTLGVTGVTTLSATTTSTSKDTGSLVVEGGLGLEENLNLGGNIDFTAGNHTLGASVGDNDFTIGGATTNVVIAGDLQVQGSATAVNTTNMDVTDQVITVNKNGNTASTIGAGVLIEGDSAATVGYVRVDGADNSLLETKAPTGNELVLDVNADATLTVEGSGTIDQDVDTTASPSFVGTTLTGTTSSTTKDTGTLIVEGGVGIEENTNIGGTLGVTGTTTLGADVTITGEVIPSVDNTYSLGSATNQWKDVYVGANSLHIGGTTITNNGGTLEWGGDDLSGLWTEATGDIYRSTGKIGIGTTSPQTSFQVDATDAIRIPVGTTAQRPSGAAELQGQIRYNTEQASFEGFDGTTWGSLGGAIDIDQDTQIQVEETADEDKIRFDTAGSERMIIDANGNVGIGNSTPGNELEVTGVINASSDVRVNGTSVLTLQNISTKTTDYTATTSDNTILVDASSGNVTITLPAASTTTGRVLVVKRLDSSTNTVVIDANLSETIDGAETRAVINQYDSFTIQSNGTSWFIL